MESMETQLMDKSKQPFEGIVVDFEKAMEAAPAGADALDVAKGMVKKVHRGYEIVVVALDEKLVRSRAHGCRRCPVPLVVRGTYVKSHYVCFR